MFSRETLKSIVYVVYDQEKYQFINGYVIKLTLLLILRLETVSEDQEGVMAELNVCSQLLT